MTEKRLLTPQQEVFLASYTDPKSSTFGNALQSALKAKYTNSYANNITGILPEWLFENIGDMKLVKKATKNLDMALDGLLDEKEKSKVIQYKATEFALKTLGKEKFSERTELTGKDGKDIIPEILTEEEKKVLLSLIGK